MCKLIWSSPWDSSLWWKLSAPLKPHQRMISHRLLRAQRPMMPLISRSKGLMMTDHLKTPCFVMWVWINTYYIIPFFWGWTSINPSYFDVNYRGTRFWHTAMSSRESLLYKARDFPEFRGSLKPSARNTDKRCPSWKIMGDHHLAKNHGRVQLRDLPSGYLT